MYSKQWLKSGSLTAVLCFLILFFCFPVSAGEAICARVKIEIRQELTLERQAFEAHMRINNGLTHASLENVNVEVRFLDQDGKPVLSTSNPQESNPDVKFFIRLDTMENITDVSGQGTVTPETSADIRWMIIPAPNAANGVPQGTLYYVGAALSYTLAGESHVTEVTPDYIYVKPMPELVLDYFLPIYVYGDDPFTDEEEEIIPFNLGVRVKNTGKGAAKNVKINSAQPKIVENKQGLLIGFKIIGSEVNGAPVTNSLLVGFGDIAPSASGTARWLMTCSLYGKFVEFKADISHADELGGELTSLIAGLNTHFLIKDILVDQPGRDAVRDFLAKEQENDRVYKVYESEGTDTEATDQSSYSTLTCSGNQCLLSAPVTAGFMYVELNDPFHGQRPIQSVLRSDGKQIKLQNTWLSKTRVEHNPWDYHLHLFDANSTGQYTVIFDNAVNNQAPELSLTANKTRINVGEEVVVLAEAVDPDGTIPTVACSALPALAAFNELGPGRAEMRWTPAVGQAGTYTVVFTAADNQLQTSKAVQLTVLAAPDADNNGMSDDWELQYFGHIGADPNADADGDGLTNLEEFLLGTDPTRPDHAPGAPVIISPQPQSEVVATRPELSIQNSIDPDNDPVFYIFEIYRDPEMTSLVESISGVGAGASETVWTPANALQDNTWYFWRVRATDNNNYSLWTYGSFFVNTQNDQPGPLAIDLPADQSQVDRVRPVLSAGTGRDVDEDDLFYTFEIYDSSNQLIASGVTQSAAGEGFVYWQANRDLNDHTRYFWRVVVTDEHGLSNETPLVSCLVNTENHGPRGLAVVSPLIDREINALETDLIVNNGTDADNDPLFYYYEMDLKPEFNTPQIRRSMPLPEGQIQTTWHMNGLKDHAWYYWRVKASDGLADSAWVAGSFFVNQHNEAPAAPVVRNPGQKSWIGTLTPTLELNAAQDPDLDDLNYSFQVYADQGMTQLIASGTVPAAQDGVVYWAMPQTLRNHQWYYWRAVSVDEHGLISSATALHAFFLYREFNEPPAVTLIEPQQDYLSNGKALRIRWSDDDADDNAVIRLYYDTDNAGYDGTLIVAGIEEDPDGNADVYFWNAAAAGVTSGQYYFYAVIDDGTAQSMSNYSPGKVTVDAVAPILTAEPPGGRYINQVEVTLTMDKPGSIYYTLDGATPDQNALVYNLPILITQNTVLKAVAVDTLGNPSDLLEQDYLIEINVNDPPVISGTPQNNVPVNTFYSFTPSASDPDPGDVLSFNIVNKPQWAAFDPSTGMLSGTPGNADVGATQGILISVTDQAGLGAALPPFDLTVAGPDTFRITVTSSKDKPLNNLTVYAYSAGGAYTGKQSVTGADGSAVFNIADFNAGSYKFRADYLGIKFWSNIVDQPGLMQVPITIAVETVEVTVNTFNGPVTGTKVYLFSETGSYLGWMQTTDDQGKVLFEVPVGYSFKFRADYLGNQYWSAPVTIAAGSVNLVTIQAGGGRLTIQVAQGEQAPLAGLKVYLFNQGGSYLGLNQTTDENGRVGFDLSAGSYKARVDYLGYQFWSELINVNADTSHVVSIPHQPVTITLADRFEDESGPIAGQKVYLFNSAGVYVGQVQTTDLNGRVGFNLPNAAYKVRADYLDKQYWSPEFTWQDQTVVVALAHAEVSVTGSGLPKADIKIYAFNAQGNYLGRNTVTDTEGKALFELPAGIYKFRADYQGGQFWSPETTLEADHVTPVGISIGGGNFTLDLLKRQDQPLANVKCYAFTAGGTYLGLYSVSDEQGRVGFALAQGGYKFRIDYLQQQYWSAVYEIPADVSDQLLIEHAGLELLVLAADEPAAGIKVYLFNDQDKYLGQTLSTDGQGKALFDLPVGMTFKIRADMLGNQYWSDSITIGSGGNTLVLNAGGGLLQVRAVITPETPLKDLRVYLYNDVDQYLGQSQMTDTDGRVVFKVARGSYKVRVDYLGQQFWSAATEILTDADITVGIAHQAVKVALQTHYQSESAPLSGAMIYLFSQAGTYLGQSRVSDGLGQAGFHLPERPFKIRADYLGRQYWTPEFIWQDQTIEIPMAEAEVSVTGAGLPKKGIRVYCFNNSGTYLGLYQDTDENGLTRFRIPEGLYKFRADYQTGQFWSGEQSLAADQVTPLVVSAGGGTFALKVMQGADQPLEGIKAYVFNQQDKYIGLFGATDAGGEASFALADGHYKFRLDHLGYQFWSGLVSAPEITAHTEIIGHQQVQAAVQGLYNSQAEIRPNLRVDLYTADEKYTGKYQTTDSGGLVVFNLPQKSYKLKANYLGRTYWSDAFTWQNAAIQIPEGAAQVKIRMLSQDLADVPVYVFSTADKYLGIKSPSNAEGLAVFRLPEGEYKFRADYQGHQYWSAAVIQKDLETAVLIQTGGGLFTLTVGTGQADLADAKVYVFNETGAYIGLNASSDIDGRVAFNLANGTYKFRIDYLGYQFWSGVFVVPESLNEVFTIQHKDIKITMLGSYEQQGQPLAGLNTYLFKSNGSYLGRTQKTDANGQVSYKLPDQEYKVRADYLGQKFWTGNFKFQDTTLTVPEGLVRLRATQAGNPAAGLNVYLFNEAGAYLGWNAKTDAEGRVEVILPNQAFKFRVDKGSAQYWSALVQVQAGQVNEINVGVE